MMHHITGSYLIVLRTLEIRGDVNSAFNPSCLFKQNAPLRVQVPWSAARCASSIRPPGRPVRGPFRSFSCSVDPPSQGDVPCTLPVPYSHFLPSDVHLFPEPLPIRYKPSTLFLFFFPPFPPASVPSLFRLVTFPGFSVRSFFTFATVLSRHPKIKLPQRRTTSARVSRLTKGEVIYQPTPIIVANRIYFIYFEIEAAIPKGLAL